MKNTLSALKGALILILGLVGLSSLFPEELPLELITLPPGFRIEAYAADVPDARSMTMGDRGTLFVGTRVRNGTVYAIRDENGDQKADRVIPLLTRLDTPNGVAFRDGSLYVALIDRVLRYDDIESRLDDPPDPVVVNRSFPSDRQHGWKFIRFSPDGWLYVPVGAPCNVCEESDPRYASITRMRPDGSGSRVFASGVRNTVGFDWHPVTGELWFTDNGRDLMGDDIPPDELNHAPSEGFHFGFPYIHGRDIEDPSFGSRGIPENFRAPAQELGPHVAALGMRFYTGSMFPSSYENRIFIAEHGSWNRSTPIGYRITLVRLQGDKAVDYEVFAEGWLQNGKSWGRPVDIHIMPDGALLVSDDKAGAIYRISYGGRP